MEAVSLKERFEEEYKKRIDTLQVARQEQRDRADKMRRILSERFSLLDEVSDMVETSTGLRKVPITYATSDEISMQIGWVFKDLPSNQIIDYIQGNSGSRFSFEVSTLNSWDCAWDCASSNRWFILRECRVNGYNIAVSSETYCTLDQMVEWAATFCAHYNAAK